MLSKHHTEYKQDSLQAWIICLTGTMFFFLESIRINMYDVLSTKLMSVFSVNAFAYGKLSAGYLFANILLLFPAGLLLDRFSTKKILITAQVICAIATLIFIKATSYEMALIASVIAGIGGTFGFLGAARLARLWFSISMLGKVMSIVVNFAMLGGLIAHVPLLKLTNYVGWRDALAIFLGCEIVIIILGVFILKEKKATSPVTASKGFWQEIKIIMSNTQNWLGGLYTSLMNLPITILGAIWGSVYLQQVYNMSLLQSSIITSYLFIGMMIGCPLVGIISDSIQSRKHIMMMGSIVTLIITLLIVDHVASSQFIISIYFFALGVFSSAQVMGYTVVAESNNIHHSSSAMGLAAVIIMSGGTFLQPLFGKLLQIGWTGKMVNNVPFYSNQNFFHAMMILPVAFCLAIIVSYLTKETFLKNSHMADE